MSDLRTPVSVKLSAELLKAAKESARIACRSTAGQIEYWAKIGRSAELSGLTTNDAEQAIRLLEPLKSESGQNPVVASLTGKMLRAHQTGSLAQKVMEAVKANRAQVRS